MEETQTQKKINETVESIIFYLQTEVKGLKKKGKNNYAKYEFFILTDIFNFIGKCQKSKRFVITHTDDKSQPEISWYDEINKKYCIKWWKNYFLSVLDEENNVIAKETFSVLAIGDSTECYGKAKGSGETYGNKYFLINLLQISEDVLDPDNDVNGFPEEKKPEEKKEVKKIEIKKTRPKDVSEEKRLQEWYAKDKDEIKLKKELIRGLAIKSKIKMNSLVDILKALSFNEIKTLYEVEKQSEELVGDDIWD